MPGDRVELAFVPASGTRVQRVRWWRSVFKQLDDNWQPYTWIADAAQAPATCDFVGGRHACGVGGTDWRPFDNNFNYDALAYQDVSNLAASTVIAGVYCRANADNVCGNGYSLTSAEVQILSAFLTISDPSTPTIGGVSGDGWTGDGWRQGDVPISVASSDVTGISATKVYADGSLIATVLRSCRYDRPRPCTDEPGGVVGVPTAGLADGAHEIDVGVVDAAGNETRVRRGRPLMVDNAAPVAPVGLKASVTTSSANAFSLTWSLPADGGAPITVARYQVCPSAGPCGEARTATSLTSIDGLTLPSEGAATVRVWLEDQMGHKDPTSSAAALVLTYAPTPSPRDDTRPTPQPPFTPTLPSCGAVCGRTTPPTTTPVRKASPALRLTTLRRVGRRVTVGGLVGARASGRITVRYRVRIDGRTRTLVKRVSIARRAFRVTLVLGPSLASARGATVSVVYPGDTDTLPQTRTAILHTRA